MNPISLEQRQRRMHDARGTVLVGLVANLLLAVVKFLAGFFGNAYALIADAIESLLDVVASCAVLAGLTVAAAPASEKYPYGRGRIETLAGLLVALFLFGAAATIAAHSIEEISTPHGTPAPFTLVVLIGVIVVKELLFRRLHSRGSALGSTSLQGEAFHQRSDALTSLAAFIGIGLAILGGPGYESADDWAALFASAVIAYSGITILKTSLRELLDQNSDSGISLEIRRVASSIEGVLGTHKCHVRKLGIDLVVDLDILVNGSMSVTEGHHIAHRVQDAIREELPLVFKVLVHVEPIEADSLGNPRSLS